MAKDIELETYLKDKNFSMLYKALDGIKKNGKTTNSAFNRLDRFTEIATGKLSNGKDFEFLDGSIDDDKRFVLYNMINELNSDSKNHNINDYKSRAFKALNKLDSSKKQAHAAVMPDYMASTTNLADTNINSVYANRVSTPSTEFYNAVETAEPAETAASVLNDKNYVLDSVKKSPASADKPANITVRSADAAMALTQPISVTETVVPGEKYQRVVDVDPSAMNDAEAKFTLPITEEDKSEAETYVEISPGVFGLPESLNTFNINNNGDKIIADALAKLKFGQEETEAMEDVSFSPTGTETNYVGKASSGSWKKTFAVIGTLASMLGAQAADVLDNISPDSKDYLNHLITRFGNVHNKDAELAKLKASIGKTNTDKLEDKVIKVRQNPKVAPVAATQTAYREYMTNFLDGKHNNLGDSNQLFEFDATSLHDNINAQKYVFAQKFSSKSDLESLTNQTAQNNKLGISHSYVMFDVLDCMSGISEKHLELKPIIAADISKLAGKDLAGYVASEQNPLLNSFYAAVDANKNMDKNQKVAFIAGAERIVTKLCEYFATGDYNKANAAARYGKTYFANAKCGLDFMSNLNIAPVQANLLSYLRQIGSENQNYNAIQSNELDKIMAAYDWIDCKNEEGKRNLARATNAFIMTGVGLKSVAKNFGHNSSAGGYNGPINNNHIVVPGQVTN